MPVLVLGVVVAGTRGGAGQDTLRHEWRAHGGTTANTRYSPLDRITRDNITRLAIAWRRPAVDPSVAPSGTEIEYSHDFRVTPLMVDGVLYASNGIGLVEAFDPGTGATRWVQRPFAGEPVAVSLEAQRVASASGPMVPCAVSSLCGASTSLPSIPRTEHRFPTG